MRLPTATTVASRFIKGKNCSSNTNVYMKYEIARENTIAVIVIIVRNTDSVYIHMQNRTHRPPDPISHVSRTKYSSNNAFFKPSMNTSIHVLHILITIMFLTKLHGYNFYILMLKILLFQLVIVVNSFCTASNWQKYGRFL